MKLDDLEYKSKAKEVAMRELQNHFRAEFINRIDAIVPFNPLKKVDFLPILNNELNFFSSFLLDTHGLSLVVTSEARSALLNKGYSREFGARDLRRTIQKEIENLLAMHIIENIDELRSICNLGSNVYVDYSTDGKKFTISSLWSRQP